MTTALQFVGGPYRPPKNVRVGDRLQSIDGPVVVARISAAPIGPWPLASACRQGGGIPAPVLYGDLLRAVKEETAAAVAHWWGVDRKLVSRWRRKLGVPRFNSGTQARWKELASSKLTPAAVKKGAKKSVAARKRSKPPKK